MTIDLRIQFLGLCLYVPEGTSRMHVLLPVWPPRGAGGHRDESGGGEHGSAGQPHDHAPESADRPRDAGAGAGHAHHVHYPRVMFDLAYKQPNQRGLSRDYQIEKLENCVLDLSGLTSAESIDVNLTPELPSLEGVAEPVNPDLVLKPPTTTGPLAARVTFGSGALTRCALGATFRLGEAAPSRMTYETEWTVRGIVPEIDANGNPYIGPFVLTDAENATLVELPTLYPIGSTIELIVFNTVSRVFPPDGELFARGKPETPAEHFEAYHELSLQDKRSRPVPMPEHPLPIHVYGPNPGKTPHGPRIPGVVCIQAQNRLGPS